MPSYLSTGPGEFVASGPVTALSESAATSMAAGVFLGGFVAGVAGVALGRPHDSRDRAAVNGGYIGGFVQAAALLIETAFFG